MSGSIDEQWQAAVASGRAQQSFAPVEALYAGTIGLAGLGLTESDLTPGALSSSFDGQVIEGIIGTGPIRPAHNNVIYRGCKVINEGLHGAYFDPVHGANITGTVIEYCDYDGGLTDVRANFWNPAVSDAVTVRYCNIRGWRSGHTAYRGARFEYSWVHDLSAAGDTHRTGALIGGRDCHYYRNYITDGGSGCCNIYFDISPVHDSSIIENILNGSSPNATPSYLINLGDGEYAPPATNIKILGNLFGREYQFGHMAGAPVPWGTNGNELGGNVWFDTGELVG